MGDWWAHSMGPLKEGEMSDGIYAVKKARKGLVRRRLRIASQPFTNPTPPALSEMDQELDWMRVQKFGPKQLTKAPRRK